MFLIDTDVLSALRRAERSPGIVRWMAEQRTTDLYMSVVSVGEIERGITRQRQRNPTFAAALAAWLDTLLVLYGERILPFDLPAARRWGRLSGALGHDGADLLIEPEAITFPTGGDGSAVAHALYFPPANPACAGPAGDRPPLLVTAHGGPTAAARRQLQLGVVYWTSRGIAVVDVDYRGSTGYGRSYRRALEGAWGVADVEDCVAAARFLADRGDVDPERLIIRGGSAGGFTVLAALALHDTFAAGASRYGIADLEALAADTHKFESRYLDRLVGPYPEARDVYLARSPIHHIDGFDAPMIVLQGDEDEIVPPAQSEMIVDALKAKGVPVAYLLFEGEQHGFRSADNIVAALEAELAFFGRVLGFAPADRLPDLEISGL